MERKIQYVSLACRQNLFDLLCAEGSADLVGNLRAYEGIPRPEDESFEVSCELVNGVRADSIRIAIMNLHRQDVLRWAACRHRIPLIEDLLFDNATDGCFGIGFADYSSGRGVCRTKIYTEYGSSNSKAGKLAHLQRLFPLLNISDKEFKDDLKRFGKVDATGIDWDAQDRSVIKVYWGPFQLEELLAKYSDVLLSKEILCYDLLRQYDLLPRSFLIVAKYSGEGRSRRTDLCIRTRRVVPFFRMFDPHKEAAKVFLDISRIYPRWRLEYIGLQWEPVEKVQFYFLMGGKDVAKRS